MTSVIVCMGVSATGKTSVAHDLSKRLGWAFEEGDHHHPQANIEKMQSGTPLTDHDRWPWLRELADIAARHERNSDPLVMTCSALKRSYRDVLRSGTSDRQMFFVHLHADYDILRERMSHRTKHFMPTSLLDDQFATLEPLEPDEYGALVDVSGSLDDTVDAAMAVLP